MAYDSISANALSLAFRDYMNNLDSATRLYAQDCMLAATDVKALRNVQLWFSNSTNFRKALNNRISADEYELRERAIKALLGLTPTNVPMKTHTSIQNRKEAAAKFGDYMRNDYTGMFVRSIQFTTSGFFISYDSYGSTFDPDDSINDEDLIEFTDMVTDQEIYDAYAF